MLISTGGTAAVLGGNTRQAIATMLALGSWADALRFAGGPDREAARTAWSEWRTSWGVPEGPDDEQAAEAIRQLLELSEPDDPFGTLYAAATSGTDMTVQAQSRTFRAPGDPAQWPAPLARN
ncbi:MAG: hypothetical protein ACK5JT_13245 [Hyphomicrobiaceae bacterium]